MYYKSLKGRGNVISMPSYVYTRVIAQKSCLNRSWHSHGAWPVEVHVCEFVGELLDVGGLHLGNLPSVGPGLTPKFTEHDEVGRRHGALQAKN